MGVSQRAAGFIPAVFGRAAGFIPAVFVFARRG
jgi:hypothetical protein